MINSISPGLVCLAGSETGKIEFKVSVTILLWVLLIAVLCGVKVLDKCSPKRFALSVSEITHELSSLRKGDGVERVFNIFFVAFQREELCVDKFWMY